VYLGRDGTAGELGHQTVDPTGPLCGCGNNGCLEAFCSTSAIAQACGVPDLETAIAAAKRGDAGALAGLERSGRMLGIAIGNAIVLLTPERVVVGGGGAAAGELLFAPLRDEVRRRVRVTNLDHLTVVAAELGIWAGAVGAAIYGAKPESLS
jgi:glucokinase